MAGRSRIGEEVLDAIDSGRAGIFPSLSSRLTRDWYLVRACRREETADAPWLRAALAHTRLRETKWTWLIADLLTTATACEDPRRLSDDIGVIAQQWSAVSPYDRRMLSWTVLRHEPANAVLLKSAMKAVVNATGALQVEAVRVLGCIGSNEIDDEMRDSITHYLESADAREDAEFEGLLEDVLAKVTDPSAWKTWVEIPNVAIGGPQFEHMINTALLQRDDEMVYSLVMVAVIYSAGKEDDLAGLFCSMLSSDLLIEMTNIVPSLIVMTDTWIEFSDETQAKLKVELERVALRTKDLFTRVHIEEELLPRLT